MSEVSRQVIVNAGSPYLGGRVKGSLSNRIDCAIDKTKNNLGALAQDTVVLGGTALAGYGVVKNKGIASALGGWLHKPFEYFVKKFPKAKFAGNATSVANWLKNVPTKYKALGVVASLALLAFNKVGNKRAYNEGRIEQQYRDQAIVDHHQKISLE